MYVHRPLHTQELLSAVQLGMNDDRSRLEIDVRLSESLLERVCQHLIAKDTEGYWRFPHASVKEYFRQRHYVWSLKEAQTELAEFSLLLLIEGFQGCQPPQKISDAMSVLRPTHSVGGAPDPVMILRLYATIFWLNHFDTIQHKSVEQQRIMALFRRFILAENDPSCSSLQYGTWRRCIEHILDKCDLESYDSLRRSSLYRYSHDISPTDNPAFGAVLFSPRNVAMKWAEECLQQNIAKTNGKGLDLLSLAARYGRDDMLEKLIGMGMKVNNVPRSGSTPLFEAVKTKQTASVKVLLKHGADVNATGLWRAGRIYNCIKHFDFEILDLLSKYGADVDATDPPDLPFGDNLDTLEFIAVMDSQGCRAETCRWLLDAGTTVNLQTQGEYGNPILTAAHCGSRHVVEFLRIRGADVHVRAETGRYYGGVLAAAFCGFEPQMMVPYLIEEAKVEPKGLLSDLLTRDHPIRPGRQTKRARAAKYLLSHKHVTIADLQKLELAAKSEPLFPTDFIPSLNKE